MICKGCNKDIPSKRIEILKKYNKPLVCVDCSTENKVVAFNVTLEKDTRIIDIVTPEQANELNRVSKQNGINYGTQ